jgi:dTDP-6-deoxy-L-talose 4-dehydrogenase (NAD+)
MKRPHIAVTGASGFVGRNVVFALRRRAVDLTLLGRQPARLAALAPEATVIPLDIADLGKFEWDRLGNPDILVHLAWDGLPNYASRAHLDSELPRQIAFLQAMLASGIPKLLVTGTCLEYGMKSGCLAEDLLPEPHTPYGQAKHALRLALDAARENRKFALTWARLFYTYGEGQSPQSLYAQINAAVARGDKLFDMSGGQQLRDFVPVAVMAETIVQLALLGCDAGAVNVCSGRPISVLRLVESWRAANGWSIQLNPGRYPYPDYEPMEFWGDRRKLDRLLAGEPNVDVNDFQYSPS